MQELKKIDSPREKSIVEIMLHCANVKYSIKKEEVIFNNNDLTAPEKAASYSRLQELYEMLNAWEEIRDDVFNKKREALNVHDSEA